MIPCAQGGAAEPVRHLAERLVQRLGVPLAGILLPDSAGSLEGPCAESAEDRLPALPPDLLLPLLTEVTRGGAAVFLADAGDQGLPGRALAVLPIAVQPPGALVVVGRAAHPWAPAEVAALESTASAAAAELRRAREAEVHRAGERRLQLLEQALELVPVGVTITDREGRIVYTNPAEARMHGYGVEELHGRTARSLGPPESWGAPAGRRVGRWVRERLNLRSDGTRFPVRLWSGPVTEGDSPVGLVTACADLTELKEAEADLRRRELSFRSIVEQASEYILRFDVSGRLRYLNPAGERDLAIPAELSAGRTAEEIAAAGVQLPWADALRVAAAERREAAGEGEMRVGPRVLWLRYRVVPETDAAGAVESLLVFASDQTEQHQREGRLIRDAERDPLTGLLNREAFHRRLERACEERDDGQRGFSVLFLDMDRFKPVNDLLGHAAGDALLIAVGERLRSCVRPTDGVARLGGDEFALLLEGAPRESDAICVVERIQRLLDVPVQVAGHDLRPSASIGIALGHGHDAADAVLRSADRAMYRAKAMGPGNYGILDSDLVVHEEAVLGARDDLRHALDEGRLVLHYQPIVALAGGRLVGLEALVRWAHPDRGTLGPQAFLPIAEQTGLIVDVDRWVLREALRQVSAWAGEGLPLGDTPVSVNISARHIARADTAEFVEHALREAGLPGRALTLEITETSVMEDRESATAVLARLRRSGVRICLDDFGTGYSALAYLRQFPFDVLKIDRSFVQRIDATATDRAIVRSILALARALGLEVTAEGVETARQRSVLRRMGCGQAQGYLIAPPVPAAEAAPWLTAGRVG